MRQQAGRVRQPKIEPSETPDLAGTCSGGEFVVPRSGEAYDPRARGPNRRFRTIGHMASATWILGNGPRSDLRESSEAKTISGTSGTCVSVGHMRVVSIKQRLGGNMRKFIAVMLLVLGTSTVSMAGIHVVPEIDSTTAAAAVALIAAAALIIRGRRKK
jgi:hypothetical protein